MTLGVIAGLVPPVPLHLFASVKTVPQAPDLPAGTRVRIIGIAGSVPSVIAAN